MSTQMEYRTALGEKIPALGFGTWQLKGDQAREMVAAALDLGYRHLDTAQLYANETEVGQGLRDSGVPRKDIFLTAKVWRERFHEGEFQRSVEETLEKLGVDQVDLLMLHWPARDLSEEQLLDWLMDEKEKGHARHIGVSNHTVAQMQKAERYLGTHALLCNQVEYHALLSQEKVLAEIRRQQMLLTAHCPLAQGSLLKNDLLADIGRRHGKHVVQVALRWLMQQDNVMAIPRSSSVAHAKINLEIFDFRLGDAEMAAIHSLQGDHREVDPAYAPAWDRP